MSAERRLDPTTPVIVGVGQVSDPVSAPDYRRWGAVDLAAAAAQKAIEDAGLESRSIDTVAGVRQFETSTPSAIAPLGRSTNYPRSVARRIGANPRRAVLEVAGGQSPQHLVTEFANAIALGQASTVLIFGSEAISTSRAWAGRDDAPDFSETVEGDLEDRGYGLDGMISADTQEHCLTSAPPQYALLENARRGRLGYSRQQSAAEIGELFAPFTRVAAQNPFAAAPVARSAAELMTVTERNRMIADPYPRFVVARDQVNQGAALLLTSVEAAEQAGIASENWVFLHGCSDLREKNLLDRPDLSRSPASIRSAELALDRAGLDADAIATFDLYSCFAIPVLNICEGLGLSALDDRGLTLTGGLPFFGGAGNNYSMHAIVETVDRARQAPESFGFVGANGGTMSKYSAAVYSAIPRSFTPWSDTIAQESLNATVSPSLAGDPQGPATVETCTVVHGREESTGVAVCRNHRDERFLATTDLRDEETLGLLLGEKPFGVAVQARTQGDHTYIRAV